MRKYAISTIFALLLALVSHADEPRLKVLFFTEPGCHDCERMHDFFERRIINFYPVELVEKDVRFPGNATLMIDLAKAYQDQSIIKEGSPAVFVADVSVQGAGELARAKIEEAVRANIFTGAQSPLERLKSGNSGASVRNMVRLPAILGAALVDAVNPCAFAVLTLLLGSLLAASRKRRVQRLVAAGIAFTLAVFICYTLIGFGILHALHLTHLKSTIYALAALLAFIVGIWNLKDAVCPSRLPNIEVPKSWRGTIEKIVGGVGSPAGAFVAGALVSWILLPCTSGPYLVALGMLADASSRAQAVMLILLYNAVFVLPFLIITALLAFGLARPYQIERWRQGHKRALHLITALVMLALAAVLVWLLLV